MLFNRTQNRVNLLQLDKELHINNKSLVKVTYSDGHVRSATDGAVNGGHYYIQYLQPQHSPTHYFNTPGYGSAWSGLPERSSSARH